MRELFIYGIFDLVVGMVMSWLIWWVRSVILRFFWSGFIPGYCIRLIF